MKSTTIELYVWMGKNRYKIGVDLGWYPGNEFKLFGLEVLTVYDGGGGVTILDVQLAKLTFNIHAYKVEA